MKKLSGILLIDDDETTNFLNQRLLDRMQVTEHIHTFVNGKQAFDYLYNVSNNNYDPGNAGYFKPELIFLDINMPVINGKSILTEIRKDKKFKDTPVVMYSTTVDPSEI